MIKSQQLFLLNYQSLSSLKNTISNSARELLSGHKDALTSINQNTMEEKLTYEAAYAELSAIAKEIENETISVDVLATKVKRASDLIIFCQEKLKSTETEVNKIISQMENPAS